MADKEELRFELDLSVWRDNLKVYSSDYFYNAKRNNWASVKSNRVGQFRQPVMPCLEVLTMILVSHSLQY